MWRALCTSQSRMASVSVGFAMVSCQCVADSWLVAIVDRFWCRSLSAARRSSCCVQIIRVSPQVIRKRDPESPWTLLECNRARSAAILRQFHPCLYAAIKAACRAPFRSLTPVFRDLKHFRKCQMVAQFGRKMRNSPVRHHTGVLTRISDVCVPGGGSIMPQNERACDLGHRWR